MQHKEQAPSVYELAPLAEVLARRFVQRWNMYPRQSDSGTSYFSVHQSLHVGLLFAHLQGDITLGTYLLDPESRGRFLVLDADDFSTWQQLQDASRYLIEQGIPSYLEPSRRGGHLWFFFEQWLSGVDMRQFGIGLVTTYNLEGIELYPKQDELDDGPGSLIRLPFGVHRRSGKRYPFLAATGEPLAPTIRQQLTMLGQAQTVPKPAFDHFGQLGGKVIPQNRIQAISIAQRAMESTGGMGPPSERIKTAVSVRDFVSQFVELSPSGKGLCPFHQDHQPSFSVHDDGNFWYCFACDMGGSVIDFWMQKQGCDFKTAVSQLTAILR